LAVSARGRSCCDTSRHRHRPLPAPQITSTLIAAVAGMVEAGACSPTDYRGGRFRHWIKVKNRTHPAYSRVQDQF
jgi:hypothetical protein